MATVTDAGLVADCQDHRPWWRACDGGPQYLCVPDRHAWSVSIAGTAWADVISTIVEVTLVPQVTGARQLPQLRQPSDMTQQSNDTENQVMTTLHRAD